MVSDETLAFLYDNPRFAFYHLSDEGVVYWRIRKDVICLVEWDKGTKIGRNGYLWVIAHNKCTHSNDDLEEILTETFELCC